MGMTPTWMIANIPVLMESSGGVWAHTRGARASIINMKMNCLKWVIVCYFPDEIKRVNAKVKELILLVLWLVFLGGILEG
jgi:hypothetical protein